VNHGLTDGERAQVVPRHSVGHILRNRSQPTGPSPSSLWVVVYVNPGKVIRTVHGDALIPGLYECQELPQIPHSAPVVFFFEDVHQHFERIDEDLRAYVIEGLA